MGMRSERKSASTWLPALPPKMPYSCCDREHVHVVHVQKVGGATIRIEIGLRDLEAHARGIGVPAAGIVHRHDEAVEAGKLGGERVREVRGEGGDAALPRHVIAKHGDGADGTGGVDRVDGGLRSSARRWSCARRTPRPAIDRLRTHLRTILLAVAPILWWVPFRRLAPRSRRRLRRCALLVVRGMRARQKAHRERDEAVYDVDDEERRLG